MKLYAILLAAVLCLSFGFAFAEPKNAIPQVDDKIAGFTVNEVSYYAPLDASIVYLTHDKTGGPIMWIANDDTERSFFIGFRTHYDTDTGVPHVFEHAALSGSISYPDPSLFFNMISNTCQTYLNASTYPFMTVYPCSSISDKQLLKMADVFLSGVFEPLVLTDIHAMEREAYRYEMTDSDAPLTLTGTVYSEMQGSYYANESAYALVRATYPGSWYATCTGGQPGLIEEMTQQDLIDFHDTYYQPSNAMTILYGDLNLEDFLTLIAGYYDRYEKVEVSTEDPNYKPFIGRTEKTVEVSAAADAASDTTLYYNIPLRNLGAEDITLLSSTIETAINNSASSLYNLMMDRYPTSSFSVSVDTSGAEPMIMFYLEQAEGISASDFAASVQEGIGAVLEEGIHYETLNAVQKQIKIQTSRSREQSNIGVNAATNIMAFYTIFGDMHFYMDVNRTFINELDKWLASGIIEKTLAEQVIEPEDCLLLTINKVPGLTEQNEAAAEQKLIDMKASMSDEEIADIIASTQDYNNWSEEIAGLNMINEVSVLTVDELPEEVHTTPVSIISENGIRYISAELENSEAVTVDLYLRADMIPVDQLQAYAFAANSLGSYSTSSHSYIELENLMTGYGISFSTTIITDGNAPDVFIPALSISIDCLKEDLPAAMDLVKEILTETQFDEFDLIRYNCAITVYSYKVYASQQDIDTTVLEFGRAAISDAALYEFNTDSYPLCRYLDTIWQMDDETLAAEAETWSSIVASLINRSNMQCTIVSTADEITHAKERVADMTEEWPLTVRDSVDYAAEMEKLPRRIAITIPGFAAYNLQIISAEEAGYTWSPEMVITKNYVYDQLLIPVMRYNNGVYTPLSSISRNEAYILAYRDPSLTTTYEEVIPSLSGMMSDMELTDVQLSNLVINAYTKLALPEGPYSIANTAVNSVLNNVDTAARILQSMEAYKSATAESVLSHGSIFDALAEKGVIVSALPATMINENPDYFDRVIDWFVE